MEVEGDGPSSSPAPASDNVGEGGEDHNLVDLEGVDALPLIEESRVAKKGEAGGFLMAKPAPSPLAQQRICIG